MWGSRIQAVIVIWKTFPRGTLGWREARWAVWKTHLGSLHMGGGQSSITSHMAEEVVRQEPTMAIELFVAEALWCGLASLPVKAYGVPCKEVGGGLGC